MRLASGLWLEDAAPDRTKYVERHSAPGISNMFHNRRSRLRRGSLAAYLGVLLTLLINIADISVTTYTQEEGQRRTSRLFEFLFRLSVTGTTGGMTLLHLPVLPSIRNVTRLKIAGANMALFGLGFESLKTMEIDPAQSFRSRRGPFLANELIDLDPCSPPRVQTIVFHVQWIENLGYPHLRPLFEALHLPALLRVYFSLYSRNGSLGFGPQNISTTFLSVLEPTKSQLQKFTVSVGDNISNFEPMVMIGLEPIRPSSTSLRQSQKLHTMSVPSGALVQHSIHANDHSNLETISLNDLPQPLGCLTILYSNAQTLE